jgi:predicted metalloendopeptidase
MTHGFDNVGRLFGPDLVIKSWWDGKTKAQYERRAQCVANYYHSYTEAGAAVDGNTTLGTKVACFTSTPVQILMQKALLGEVKGGLLAYAHVCSRMRTDVC